MNAAALVLLSCLLGVMAETEISFVSPLPQTPLFGEVEVVVAVTPRPSAGVELLLDGRPVGKVLAPPFRFRVDVGEDNRRHRFEAVAHGVEKAVGRAVLESPAVQLHEVVDLGLQQIYVTVNDRHGRRVLDLERDDFRLWDEDQEQNLVTFESGEIPFTAVLLLDASSSMRDGRLEAAVTGARVFLEGMQDYDEASVLVFSDRLLEASPFAGPEAGPPPALLRAEPFGGTAVHDQLFLALRSLETRQGRRVVVLLSDGEDIHSVLGAAQVERTAQRSQAQIYWLRLVGNGQRGVNQYESWHDRETGRHALRRLASMAESSGGRIIDLEGAADIESAFAEVLRELREQYALGYYPSRDLDDGSWHPWKLEVPPKLRARAAAGYADF